MVDKQELVDESSIPPNLDLETNTIVKRDANADFREINKVKDRNKNRKNSNIQCLVKHSDLTLV